MERNPTLSVLVCTHNKPALTWQLALSIAMAKDTPESVELLIYQSGPLLNWSPGYFKHNLEKTLIQFGFGGRFSRIVIIEDPCNFGICVGFNTLIELARGKYLCLTNDDMIFNEHGWFTPLQNALESGQGIGVACSRIINDPRPYDLHPQADTAHASIRDFSGGHKGALNEVADLQMTESNQPWLVKKESIARYAAQDPITNQKRWLCEWIDPRGVGWYVDWGAYQQVKLAGDKICVVPQSVVYHYDHVTVRDIDRNEPGWTNLPRQRYTQKWGTEDKSLPAGYVVPQFRLEGDGLVRI